MLWTLEQLQLDWMVDINTVILSVFLTDPRPMDFGKDSVFNHKPPIDGGEV